MNVNVQTAPTEVVGLADGRDAALRLLESGDRPGLQALFDGTSPDNLYTRFFGLGTETVTRHLDHLFAGDPTVSAYVVTSGTRVIGVVDVETLEDSTAEIAFLVADDMHHQGIATLLLERAAADAEAAGVRWFVADVLAINHPMLEVFADSGYRIERVHAGSDISLRMSTETDVAVVMAQSARAAAAELRRSGH